jgi:hypothetical protein
VVFRTLSTEQRYPWVTVPRWVSYQWLSLCLALGYALVLASLPVDVFKDRSNYLIYASHSEIIFERYLAQGWLSAFSNEPVWLWLNTLLALFWSPERVVRILIFFPAFAVALVVLRHDSRQFLWLLLILLMPQVIKNHIIHLRQGVAISVFMLGWIAVRPWQRWSLWLLAPLIHTSFFFVLSFWVFSQFLVRLRFAMDLRTLLYSIVGITVGLGLGLLATVFGARQATRYGFGAADISGLGFIFWGFLLLLTFWQGREYQRTHAFAVSILIVYLSTYFLTEVTARVFESALLIVLLALLQLKGLRRQIFLAAIIFFFLWNYAGRLGSPWLGWAWPV